MNSHPSPCIQPTEGEKIQDLPHGPHHPSHAPLETDGETETPLQGDENELTLGKKRKLTSKVWTHFTTEVIDGKKKAICKYCSKKLGGDPKNGTTHLHDHHKVCLMRKVHEAKTGSQKKLVIDKTSEGKSQLVFKEFKQEVSRKELANFIILDDQPLSIVDHVGFKRFVASLQPRFTLISRNTVKSDVFKIFDHEKMKLMNLLASNSSRVGITTDMWTSQNQRRGYMVITAHWIDSNRILRFAFVKSPHTAAALSKVLVESFLDWNIDRKLSTLTVDNCSTNNALINLVLDKLDWGNFVLRGEYFHMRCCAHILNLIVRDGMEIMGKGLENIRDSVDFWRASPKREEKFEEACRQLGIAYSRKLCLYCKTRWNSTFLMLQIALLYRDVFPCLKRRESSYKCSPSFEEWELAHDMCGRLQLFHDVTVLFSGRKYPTANLYFPKLMEIKWTLSRWVEDRNESIRLMAEKMVSKFDIYWSVIHGMMGVAAMLDPRFKNKILDVYKGDEAGKIRKICYDMFFEYEKKCVGEKRASGEYNAISSSADESSTSARSGNIVRFDDVFTQCIQPDNMADSSKNELDLYFDERLHPNSGDFDVLEWWRTNGSKYPIVSTMARDILAIPLTTVASESAFSASGRLLDPYRSRTSPKILESLMCSKSWLWSEFVDEGESVGSFYNALLNDDEGKDVDDD